MTASIGKSTSPTAAVPESRSLTARVADALTSTAGLLVIFLVLQVAAAVSFRGVDSVWPNGRMNWDGEHYSDLATQGYPGRESLPMTHSGPTPSSRSTRCSSGR